MQFDVSELGHIRSGNSCCLFGYKPFHKAMPTTWNLGPKQQKYVIFESKYNYSISMENVFSKKADNFVEASGYQRYISSIR